MQDCVYRPYHTARWPVVPGQLANNGLCIASMRGSDFAHASGTHRSSKRCSNSYAPHSDPLTTQCCTNKAILEYYTPGSVAVSWAQSVPYDMLAELELTCFVIRQWSCRACVIVSKQHNHQCKPGAARCTPQSPPSMTQQQSHADRSLSFTAKHAQPACTSEAIRTAHVSSLYHVHKRFQVGRPQIVLHTMRGAAYAIVLSWYCRMYIYIPYHTRQQDCSGFSVTCCTKDSSCCCASCNGIRQTFICPGYAADLLHCIEEACKGSKP